MTEHDPILEQAHDLITRLEPDTDVRSIDYMAAELLDGTVNAIIALVRADERKRIREALLVESNGFIVARYGDGEPEATFATKPWMEKILAAIGLTEEQS